MSREDHVRSAMASEGKTTRQHGEFRHVSVSERQRSRLCGQNLCGAFVRLYWHAYRDAIVISTDLQYVRVKCFRYSSARSSRASTALALLRVLVCYFMNILTGLRIYNHDYEF